MKYFLPRFTSGFMSDLGFGVEGLGFCAFRNKSRQPFGHSADIRKCINTGAAVAKRSRVCSDHFRIGSAL